MRTKNYVRSIGPAVGVALIGWSGCALALDMKMASSAPKSAPWYQEMVDQAERIAEKSDGAINVEIFEGGALGDEAKIVQGVRRGRIESGIVSTSPLATVVPEIGVLEIPFLWNSSKERDFVLDTYLLDAYRPLFDKAGLKLLAWTEVGVSSISANRPVLTPQDAKGLRLRVPESAVAAYYIDRLGANPVDIPVMEAVSSLQTGLVDGIYTTTPALYLYGLHKNVSDVTLEESSYYAITHIVSKRWFDGLTPEEQSAIMEDAESVSGPGRKRLRELAAQLTDKIAEGGTTVHTLTEEQRAVWKDYMKDDAAEIVEMLGGQSAEIFQIIQDGKAAFAAKAN